MSENEQLVSSEQLEENANEIAMKFWAQEGETSYAQMVERVVNYIYEDLSAEQLEKQSSKSILMNKDFIPNSPCWTNAGTDMKSLAACFVIDLQDNMVDIMETAKKMALIMKEGGGVGVSLSNIRPKGARVGKEGSKRTASGPIPFLQIFDSVVGAVKSAGVRRGAAMANLRVDHPDIIEFIRCKEDQNKINNFNISVAITDEFMRKVLDPNDKETWTIETKEEWNEETRKVEKISIPYTAKEVYDLIIDHMWKNGEPGAQFIDNVNNSVYEEKVARDLRNLNKDEDLSYDPKEHVKYTGRPEFIAYNTNLKVSNPCGETWLHPNEACNLGHINLYNFITPFWSAEPGFGIKKGKGWIDVLRLKVVVDSSVDFMNRMIDKSEFPLPEITEQVRTSRKIGIGVMGLADTLSALAVPYNSEEGREVTEFLLNFITREAEEYSLAKGWKNATLTLIAPTGTTGIVGNVSGGIEPHFLRIWEKTLTDNRGKLIMAPRSLVEFKESKSYKSNQIEYDLKIPIIWPTAHEISPEDHIRMLISVQKCVHNSVSKTINLPNKSKAEDISGLIQMAWEGGVKGFTCYRDGSRDSQPMKKLSGNTADSKTDGEITDAEVTQILKDIEKGKAVKIDGAVVIKEETYNKLLNQQAQSNKIQSIEAPKRPRPLETFGVTRKLRTGCGNLYVTVNSDDQGVCEVFTNLGRTGGCPSQSEAVCRLISLALRANVSPEAVVEQLKGIRCMSVLRKNQDGILNKDIHITSCPDAIGKVIEKELQKISKSAEKQEYVSSMDLQLSAWASNIGHAQEAKTVSPTTITTTLIGEDSNSAGVCPECGSGLQRNEGCMICRNCGFSKCG